MNIPEEFDKEASVGEQIDETLRRGKASRHPTEGTDMPAFIGIQRAVVVHAVDPEGDPDEPRIRLADGQEVSPIECDRYVPLDTEGEAEYVIRSGVGLWKFTPDE